MAQFQHLSLDERIKIQSLLTGTCRLGAIARELKRDRKTIVREIRENRTFVFCGTLGAPRNDCAHLRGCKVRHLCERCLSPKGICHLCGSCNDLCKDFQRARCERLEHPPFCCNGCRRHGNCTIRRFVYDAAKAHDRAVSRLRDARGGILLTPLELERTDQLVSPLLRNGQSVHHIYISHADELFCSERTLYSLIDSGCLAARNMDLRLKVRRKIRRRKPEHKIDRACRKGRTYEDLRLFLANSAEPPVVEMDTVEGCADSAKVLLTLFFPQAQLLLCRIRDFNTARSVLAAIDGIEKSLGNETFRRLFPVLLTDNGSEFTDPTVLETGGRTRVFYCDPQKTNQKARVERAHEFIRFVRPKGSSFDDLSQSDIDILCSHINSYSRKSLGDKCPFDVFEFIYGKGILVKLGVTKIEADRILLTPRLLP